MEGRSASYYKPNWAKCVSTKMSILAFSTAPVESIKHLSVFLCKDTGPAAPNKFSSMQGRSPE